MSSEPTDIVEMVNRRVGQGPEEIYLIELDDLAIPYEAMAQSAMAMGEKCDAIGLECGDVVGVYAANQFGWVTASLGCWTRGLTVAAINRLTPPQSASDQLRLVQAKAVWASGAGRSTEAFGIPTLELTEYQPPRAAKVSELPGPNPSADAAILFTSGTTGRPKAFRFSHARLVDAARRQALSYARRTEFQDSLGPTSLAPIVSFTPFGHLMSYSSLAFSLWTGRRLVLVEKFGVEAVKVLLERYPVKALRLNPTAIYMLATSNLDLDLAQLDYVYSGTAPLPTKTHELFIRRYGVPILQGYGQSETGVIALSRYKDVVSGREPKGSVGRVVEGVRVRITDAEGLALPPGREGEIQVMTSQAAVAMAESTLSETPDGFIRTGDAGRVDDNGYLWVTGRLTDKIVVGGFNVFPVEVEEVLRQCAAVRDAAVVGLPDDRLGERPVAGIVWSGDPDETGIIEFARERLATYKVPRAWFDLDEVPLTERGKIDRRRVASIAEVQLAKGP